MVEAKQKRAGKLKQAVFISLYRANKGENKI